MSGQWPLCAHASGQRTTFGSILVFMGVTQTHPAMKISPAIYLFLSSQC